MSQNQVIARQYLEKQIQNASPAQQIVMLYDGAIRFLTKAKMAIQEGNIQERCNNNQRALEIVAYLLDILDVEKGGDIGLRLNKIYAHLMTRMLDIDMENSVEIADEVIAHLHKLRESWVELAKQDARKQEERAQVTQAPKSESDVPVKRSALA